jgi:NTE family protein
MPEKTFNTGIVLSGGGARGFAHLGVLEALNENGIFPDVISGASAGALVGVLYSDGYTPREILRLMCTGSMLHYMRPTVPRSGLLQISGLTRMLEAHLKARLFNELKIPLFVSATDLNNAVPVYFSQGELIDRVIASASIPVLFNPVVIDNVSYVDGGVLDNLPLKPIEGKCSFLIGSFVNPVGKEDTISGLLQIAERTFMVSMSKEIGDKARKFDLFIAPPELKDFRILDPEKGPELFEIGYRATTQKLQESGIKEKILLLRDHRTSSE